MSYTSVPDNACYPGTQILKNKAGLKIQAELDKFELAMFLLRSEDPWPIGRLNLQHYKDLHHHFFQDVYEWAGKFRDIRIGKNGHRFCFPEHIENLMGDLFEGLAKRYNLRGYSRNDFILLLTHFLSELNAIHPFREGNGRTQMAFSILLTENAGFQFNYEKLEPETVLEAMIHSFRGNLLPLQILLNSIVSEPE